MIEYQLDEIEKLLLPSGCTFDSEQQAVIDCWESKEIAACPGSGKTTLLLAKLRILSEMLPFEGGRGICALSHTNVAVDTIISKFDGNSQKILAYPNFVGTIQSFINTFLTLPFLRNYVSEQFRLVDNYEYAQIAYSYMLNTSGYQALLNLTRAQSSRSNRGLTHPEYLGDLYLTREGLYSKGSGRRIAGYNTRSCEDYKNLISDLVCKEGLLTYDISYVSAQDYFSKDSKNLMGYLSERFKYVFIDEYQDCSATQRHLLDELFDPSRTTIQKIGDSDQAIFNQENDSDSGWQAANLQLTISKTNRFGKEIADIVYKLRGKKEIIKSSVGDRAIKPTVIVFKDELKERVLESFALELQHHNLPIDGIYKAVGSYRRTKGVTIGSYWKDLETPLGKINREKYTDRIRWIIQALTQGEVFEAVREYRSLLYRVFKHFEVRNLEGKRFTRSSFDGFLDTDRHDEFRSSVFEMSRLREYSFNQIHDIVYALLITLFPETTIKSDDEYFTSDSEMSKKAGNNVYHDIETGYKIAVDTVHGVKGETHDATLFLETVSRGSSDLKRTLPLLIDRSVPGNAIHENNRKTVYVGFTRPRYLLCVAISESSFQTLSNVFNEDWKIIKLGTDF